MEGIGCILVECFDTHVIVPVGGRTNGRLLFVSGL